MSTLRNWLGQIVGPYLFKEATILHHTLLAPQLHLLRLTAPSLADQPPQPGDKMQLMMPGMHARTYTPFDPEAASGAFSLLVFEHAAEGLGAAWSRQIAEGQTVSFFGPRASLPLAQITGPRLLATDETGLALACAARAQQRHENGAPWLFVEAQDPEAVRTAALALGFDPAELVIVPAAPDAHPLAEAVLGALRATEAQPALILTGRAQSIQAIRAQLKAEGRAVTQHNKGYWAPGRRGLD